MMKFKLTQSHHQFEHLVKPRASQLLNIKCQHFKFWHQIHSIVGAYILNGTIENESKCLGTYHVSAVWGSQGSCNNDDNAQTGLCRCQLCRHFSSPGALPATSVLSTAVALPECRHIFFLSLVNCQCQLRRIMPDCTLLWQLYKCRHGKIIQLVLIKNSYSFICN